MFKVVPEKVAAPVVPVVVKVIGSCFPAKTLKFAADKKPLVVESACEIPTLPVVVIVPPVNGASKDIDVTVPSPAPPPPPPPKAKTLAIVKFLVKLYCLPVPSVYF